MPTESEDGSTGRRSVGGAEEQGKGEEAPREESQGRHDDGDDHNDHEELPDDAEKWEERRRDDSADRPQGSRAGVDRDDDDDVEREGRGDDRDKRERRHGREDHARRPRRDEDDRESRRHRDIERDRHHHHQSRHHQHRRDSPSRSRSRPRRPSKRDASRSPPAVNGTRARTKRSRDEEEYLRLQKKGREDDSRRGHEHQSRSRASRTVLIAQLGMDVTDRTVYLVMSKQAGKVRDVQIIRDGRSQRSKGIAYVEFEDQNSAVKALGIEPTSLWTKLGHGANIQPSQAERNLYPSQSVSNAYGERVNECRYEASHLVCSSAALRLYVGGSANLVADLSEDDLRALFQPFGSSLGGSGWQRTT